MKKISVIYAILALTACQSMSGNYGESLQSWIGRSEMSLEQAWGYPQNTFYVTPDEKVLTYVRYSRHQSGYEPYQNEIYYPAIATPNFGFPAQPEYSNYYCKTSFTIINGVVSNYSFNGDDCVGAGG